MTTPPDGPSDGLDPVERRLRDALVAEAASVEPAGDGLDEIRNGIALGRQPAGRRWWQFPGAPALAAAAVLLLMTGGVAIALHGNGSQAGDGVTAGNGGGPSRGISPAPTTSSSDGSAAASPLPSTVPPSSSPPIPIEGDVVVYYVRDDATAGRRLYRESRPNPGTEPVAAALSALFDGPPVDPDYVSSWPTGTTVTAYTVDGTTGTVRLGGGARTISARPVSSTAVQQIVYTVTANDVHITKVRVLIGSEVVTPADGAVPAPATDVLALIQLTSPAEGATVTSPVDISGTGTAFEGTISWEITSLPASAATGSGAGGTTMGGANGELAEFHTTADLAPGTYKIRAFEASAKDGSALHVDTKTFTVK